MSTFVPTAPATKAQIRFLKKNGVNAGAMNREQAADKIRELISAVKRGDATVSDAFTRNTTAVIGHKTAGNYMTAGEVRAALADLHENDLTNLLRAKRPITPGDLLRIYFES